VNTPVHEQTKRKGKGTRNERKERTKEKDKERIPEQKNFNRTREWKTGRKKMKRRNQ